MYILLNNTMNNPSAHPSYSHYYLLSPSTLFFSFFFCTSYCFFCTSCCFFAHLIVFCTSYCFLHILLFCTFLFHCTFYSYFSFSYHMYALVLLLIQFVFLLFCTVHWADLIRLHFTSSYALYNYYVTNKETLKETLKYILKYICCTVLKKSDFYFDGLPWIPLQFCVYTIWGQF